MIRPPFFICFTMLSITPRKFLTTLAEDFCHLSSPGTLIYFLHLESQASLIGAAKNPTYQYYSIRKKNGTSRLISEAGGETLRIQKRLNEALQAIYYTVKPSCVHGFVRSFGNPVRKRSILTNARTHLRKDHILTIDLRDFFPSVTARMVSNMFSGPLFDFSENLSACLAMLVTDKGRLPQGATTSPVISNLVLLRLDHELMRLAREHHLTYSRFADDLTFSSRTYIEPQTAKAIEEIIQAEGFQVNAAKTHYRSAHTAQYVTGIKVNQKMNVDRRYIRRIRAILHDWKLRGERKAANRFFRNIKHPLYPFPGIDIMIKVFHQSVRGRIEFVGQVKGKEDPVYLNLKKKYEQQVRIYPLQ